MIHYLAKYGNFKSLEIFLGKDIDFDVVNKNKETALVNKNIFSLYITYIILYYFILY